MWFCFSINILLVYIVLSMLDAIILPTVALANRIRVHFSIMRVSKMFLRKYLIEESIGWHVWGCRRYQKSRVYTWFMRSYENGVGLVSHSQNILANAMCGKFPHREVLGCYGLLLLFVQRRLICSHGDLHTLEYHIPPGGWSRSQSCSHQEELKIK